MRPTVVLEKAVIDRCYEFAHQIVSNYVGGHNDRSRSVSSHGADVDIELQARAKMAECAFAIWARIGIERVSWMLGPDNGADFTVRANLRVDIKHTGLRSRYLIWPLRKNALFESKQFDAIVLVKSEADLFEISGWISKIEFSRRKLTAAEGHALTAGTWYVPEEILSEPNHLSRSGFVGHNKHGLWVHYCHCGAWGAHGYGEMGWNMRYENVKWYCAKHRPEVTR